MNNGIKQSRGEYLFFLNSGDYLIDQEVLKKVFAKDLKQDLVYGNIVWDTNGSHSNATFPALLTFEFLTTNSLPHQGSFFKKKLFETVGLYDEQYPIIADWVFFLLSVYKYNCSYLHIDEFISICGRDGISCLSENWPGIVSDRQKATRQNFSAFQKDFENHYALRSELSIVKNELKLTKLTFGYRLQKKLERLLKKVE
jgi:glycosyltransferase involved in cell wall biosynthesis